MALLNNRHFIGFELSEEYCKIANERIRKALAEKGGGRMKHLGNICNISGAEVEPFPIAVTMYHFKEARQ